MIIKPLNNNLVSISKGNDAILLVEGGEICNEIVETFYYQIKDSDLNVKIGLFSSSEGLIQDLEKLRILENRQTRLSFITPFIEKNLEEFKSKNYDLYILKRNTIYDYRDWEDYLTEIFKNIYKPDLPNNINLNNYPVFKEEKWDLSFNFEKGIIPYSFDDKLELVFDEENSQFSLILKKAQKIKNKVDVKIQTRGI
jgi:hypothetical protein